MSKLSQTAIITTILISGLVLSASLNYSGFCFKKLRYLSREEKIKSLFEKWNQRKSSYVEIESKLKVLDRKNRYGSFEEFLATHPNCCQVKTKGPFVDLPPPGWIARVTGNYSGSVVIIQFKEQVIDEKGNTVVADVKLENALRNCGELKWGD